MKLKALMAGVAAMSMTAAPVVAAAPTGVVKQGSAVVLRDGKAMLASEGASVLAGDRVVSRDSSVSLGFGSCSRDLDSASMLDVSSNACSTDVATLSRASTELEGANQFAPAIIIGVIALAAIIGGAVIIADNDDEPTSP